MEKDATIVGTREGYYLACIDEEESGMDCSHECPLCNLSSRILLDKDQPIEKGRRILAEIDIPIFVQKGRLYAAIAAIYVIVFFIMLFIIRSQLPYYQGIWPAFFGGFFGASSFYLIQKMHFEKKGGEKRLRRGRIIRVYPPENS